jgi:hypothetical protein
MIVAAAIVPLLILIPWRARYPFTVASSFLSPLVDLFCGLFMYEGNEGLSVAP